MTEADGRVATGIEVLKHTGYAALKGLRIGLITNHTGRDESGVPTIDLLHRAPDVHLATLFSPEHGIRGRMDEAVGDSRDEATGLPVYSLYGARSRPSAEQLAGLDALVYDIQDVGSRFYTYSSTLGLCMEAAAQHQLRYFVLDRPNPIGGVAVEGPLADPDKLSFTAYHTVPVRHGLTVGELARLYNGERHIGAALTVVELERWRRSEYWPETGLRWINPSPNMRSATEALLYPGICLLEPTNISVGRGTATPFEVIGAPWIDERRLASELGARNLTGVRFAPIRYTPTSSVYADRECGGLRMEITDRDAFVPVLTGMAIADTLYHLYRNAWEYGKFDRLLVNAAAYAAFLHGKRAEELVASWEPQDQQFRDRRRPYLLYS